MWLAGLEMLTTNPPLLRSLKDRLLLLDAFKGFFPE